MYTSPARCKTRPHIHGPVSWACETVLNKQVWERADCLTSSKCTALSLVYQYDNMASLEGCGADSLSRITIPHNEQVVCQTTLSFFSFPDTACSPVTFCYLLSSHTFFRVSQLRVNFWPLSIALFQHPLHVFRKLPSGFRVLSSDQVTGTDNLRLWMHVWISGRSKTAGTCEPSRDPLSHRLPRVI